MIQSPATVSSSDASCSENENRKVTVTCAQLPNQVPERSPALRRYQHQRISAPVGRIDEEECDANGNAGMVERNNKANRNTNSLRLPRNKVEPLPRKPLLRSEAIDQDQQESSSSGGKDNVCFLSVGLPVHGFTKGNPKIRIVLQLKKKINLVFLQNFSTNVLVKNIRIRIER